MAESSVFESLLRILSRPVSLGGAAVLAVFLSGLLMLVPALRGPGGLAGDKPLKVSELIRKVKEELHKAEQEGLTKNELALFELKEFELVIHFVVTNTGEVGAQVVGIGSKADVKTENLQKITLRWTAVPPQEKRIGPSEFPLQPDVIVPVPGTLREERKP